MRAASSAVPCQDCDAAKAGQTLEIHGLTGVTERSADHTEVDERATEPVVCWLAARSRPSSWADRNGLSCATVSASVKWNTATRRVALCVRSFVLGATHRSSSRVRGVATVVWATLMLGMARGCSGVNGTMTVERRFLASALRAPPCCVSRRSASSADGVSMTDGVPFRCVADTLRLSWTAATVAAMLYVSTLQGAMLVLIRQRASCALWKKLTSLADWNTDETVARRTWTATSSN